MHKPVLPQLPGEIVGTFVLTTLMALSVMAGIGGGGIVVPMLMAFYSLGTKESIAISGFTIFTGAITRYVVTWTHKHPTKDAVCVEYGLTNIMQPMVMIGSIIGVFFNLLMPAVISQICLTILLFFLTIQSYQKAMELYNKENDALIAADNYDPANSAGADEDVGGPEDKDKSEH